MIRPVIRYFATLGSAGLLAALGALVSPVVWPTDPDASLVVRNGQLVGEVVGYIWQADPHTAIIHVSSSVLGLRAFPVRIDPETRITDGDKEGGFGDLGKHARVRVLYEAHPRGRRARSIELLHHDAPLGPAVGNVLPGSTAGYWVEVGVFYEADAAGILAQRLLEHGMIVSIEPLHVDGGRRRALRVQVGPFADERAALAAQHNLRVTGFRAQALW
jgi:hypothetical protein